MKKFREYLNQPFSLLDHANHRWVLIVFNTLFIIFFVNVLVPFNINRWSNDTGLEQLIRLSGFGLIAGIILLISQFGIRKIFKVEHFCIGTYTLWIIGEIFLMAISFLFYQGHWNISMLQFIKEIPDSFKYTILGAIIPYLISLLLISQIIHMERLKKSNPEITQQISNPDFINFPDEKGIVRFSIATEHLLYLESADNYVIIFHQNGNKISKQILRNSMKNIEGLFENTTLRRCHRSFTINRQKIEFVDYEKAKCRIKLTGIENLIPVSRKFFPDFKPQMPPKTVLE